MDKVHLNHLSRTDRLNARRTYRLLRQNGYHRRFVRKYMAAEFGQRYPVTTAQLRVLRGGAA